MKKLCLSWVINLAVLIGLAGYAIASESVIEVKHPQHPPISLTFQQAPRLDAAVITATNHYQIDLMDINWLQSSLFDKTAAFHLKGKTLASISEQEVVASNDEKSYWRALATQIQHWQFSSRVTTPLDPDVTRLVTAKNPRLKGNYQIFLHDYQTTPSIHVLGHVKQTKPIAWYPRKSAIDYLELARVDTNSLSIVWVIQPDGNIFEYPVAYWNYQFHNIAPGAIIYIPMPLNSLDNTETAYKNTNQLVLKLLTQRHPL